MEVLVLKLEETIMATYTVILMTNLEVETVKEFSNNMHMKLVLKIASVSIKFSKVSKCVVRGGGTGVGRGVGD